MGKQARNRSIDGEISYHRPRWKRPINELILVNRWFSIQPSTEGTEGRGVGRGIGAGNKGEKGGIEGKTEREEKKREVEREKRKQREER